MLLNCIVWPIKNLKSNHPSIESIKWIASSKQFKIRDFIALFHEFGKDHTKGNLNHKKHMK